MVFCSPTLEWAEGPPRGTFLISLACLGVRAASDLLVINICASERKYASCFLPASPKYSSGRRLFSAVHYFCICLSLFESSVMQQRLFVPHLANGCGSVQICFSSSALFMLVSFCRARIIKVIFAVARNNKAAAQSRIITQR
jgi:hypothetical protein